MKLKLLNPELTMIIGDQIVPSGTVTSVKIVKKNNFIILETFGVYLETDLTVQGLTASYGMFTDKISLQWNPFVGIDGYKVFKSPAQLLSIQTGITFDDTSIDPGKLTKYFVKTFIIKDGLTYDSNPVYADGWKKLISPTIRLTGEPDVPRVILDWDSVEGATAYKIFRTEGSDPALLAQYGITGSSPFIDRKVQFGKVYSYSVKSSCSLGDSDLSNVDSVILRGQVPAAPSQVSASTGQFTDKVRITWTPVPNVFFYNVYRGSETNRIATNIVGTEFDDFFTSPEETNIYGVGAENINGQGIVTFSSPGWKGLSAPSNFNASDGGSTNSVLLEWFPVQGANSYKIYKGNPLQEYQTGISGLSFNDTTELVYGTIFNYGVRAVGSLGESQISEDTGFIDQIPPEITPTGVSASDGEYTDKIKIIWNPVTTIQGISGYKIYRNNQSINQTTNTFFDDQTVSSGVTFEYSVSAFNLAGEGLTSAGNTGWIKLSAPQSLQASTNFNDRINLEWLAVNGATAYKIFTATSFSPETGVTLLGITTNTQFTDFTPTFGQNYRYAVKGSCLLGDSDYSSDVLGSVIQSPPEFAPTGVSASDGAYTNKIEITWNAVSTIQGVCGYKIYKNNQLTGQTFSTLFFDSANPGVTFEYSVSAFNLAGEGLTSAGNTGWVALEAPTNLSATNNLSDRINLQWLAVNGATEYKVFTATSFSPEIGVSLLGTTSNTQFTDFTPTFGQNYRYAVKGSCSLGDSVYSSDVLGSVIQSPPEFAPTGVSASDGAFTDRIDITWNPVTTIQGVSGYNVLKNGGIFTTTSSTNTTDSVATPGLTSEYTVIAFNNAGSGPLSSGNTGWIKLSSPANLFASKFKSISEIELNWSQSNGATNYKVFRGASLGSLSEIDQTTNTTYINTGLGSGISFAYAVKASCDLGDSDFSNLDIGETGTPIPVPDPPTGLSASDGAFTDRIDITWDSVAGISGYNLFRNGSQIAQPATETFTDTPSPGVIFNYEIAARNATGIGNKSSGNTGWRALVPPVNFTATNNLADRVNLNWTAAAGATAYKIFTGSSFNPDINVALVGFTTNTSFSDFTPTFGVGYTYAVKSSCALGDSAQFSVPVRGSVIQSPPEFAPTGVSASDGAFTDRIDITWNPVTTIQGVSGYSVFRNTSLVGQTTGITFSDVFSTRGQTFDYTIRAFNRAGNGPLSTGNTGWINLTAPGFISATTNLKDKVVINWGSVSGNVSGYKVFTATSFSPPTNISLLGSVGPSITVFDHVGPTYGVEYKYAIKASSLLGDSDFSATATGKVSQSAPEFAPTGVTASDGDFTDKIRIIWNPVTTIQGVSGYKIFRETGVLVDQTPNTTYDHILPNNQRGFTFEYKVLAFNREGGDGPLSSGNTGWMNFVPPSNLLTVEAQDKITLVWNKSSGNISNYKIFTGNSFNPPSGVSLIGTVSATADLFDHFGPTYGVGYTYAMKTVGALGESDFSVPVIGTILQSPPETAPTGVSASDGTFNNKVLITWTPPVTIMGVSSYNVHKIAPNGSVSIQNTTTIPFEDSTGIPGLTFEYKIAAVNLAGIGPLSTGNTGWKGLTAPTQFAATDGTFTNKIRLDWNSIHGTDISYRIYKGNPLTPLTTTTSTFFEDTTAAGSPGITLQYAVSAFSSLPIESIVSNPDIGFIGLTAPSNIVATQGTVVNEVGITWDAVAGAQQYKIYKDDTSNLIGITFSNSFGDTLATPGLTHGYFVSTFLPGFPYESVKSSRIVGWKKLQTPTGLTASKGDFSDKVRISWNTVPGATAYKIFKGDDFNTEANIITIGITTGNVFFDTTSLGVTGATYAVKASCTISDSNYSNTDKGYVNSIYSDIITYANEIQARYKENTKYPYDALYAPAPPRLSKWTGPLYWNPITAKTFVEGVTAVAGKMNLGFTQGTDIYHNYIQFAFNIGMRLGTDKNNGLGSTASYPELKFRKYDPNPFWTDLNGTLGITLREGTANRYIRHRTLNDIATKPPPGFSPDTASWTQPRNKLFWSMGSISDDYHYYVFQDLEDMCATWRFMLPVSAGFTAQRAIEPTVYKSHLNARIQTQDYLNVIKTMLMEIKNHYPLAIPRNGVNNKAAEGRGLTGLWTDAAGKRQYVGMSGGYRIISPPIGATLDFDPTTGQTVNTWSPEGPTADQGEYLFDSWKRKSLLKSLYMLEGITTAVNPEGISGGQLLSQDPSWDILLRDLRALLTKELRDHVKHFWERRAWYMVVGDIPGGRDSEFGTDMDNLGWIQGNQWLDPLASVIQIAMYLYPFASTEIERQALLAAYNMCSESLAGMIERALDACTDCSSGGVWTEGFGYAAQSYPPILSVLTDMKRMGDRRLWDTVTKRGKGVPYSCWANNAWKWMYSRVMPNNAIINSGSCDSSDYGGGTGNGYQIYGWPHEHIAILASEYPPPGEKGSALSTVYGRNKKMSGLVYWYGATNLYYELKKYHENGLRKPYRDYSNGHYFPDDQTFTWTSDFIIPDLQDERVGRAINPVTYAQEALTSKPFIFGIWGKGSCKFDGKAHRDEGHVSAYMGDAMILLELGEIRADESNARKYLEKESPGHNRMQLGGFRKFNWPRPATITGVVMGKTGGSLFMDTTSSYNTRSLTFANEELYPWMPPSQNWFRHVRNGQKIPWGYGPNDEKLEYQYQISKVTRGISWAYEPFNKVSSYIKITDFMGLSGICAGVSGPTERVYYRFHAGHTGATSGTDSIFILGAVPATNNRVWTAGWTAPLSISAVAGGYTCDYVGITMTFSADQPISIIKTLVSHRANKEAQLAGQQANFADQLKNYALDIRLGLSGTAVHNEMKLNLVTEINSMVFRNNAPIIIPIEKPQIRHYAPYTLNSTVTIAKNTGCSSQFAAPTNIFPSWSVEISKLSGISFGQIMIDHFTTLPARSGFTLPNATWTCP